MMTNTINVVELENSTAGGWKELLRTVEIENGKPGWV